ncbi:MAG: hypothetical protein LBD01_05005 [Puniceicoccales bacterium]|nr:hypothetical protein [Puniceicoccales bacterium]
MRVVPEANEQHKLRQERRELDTALLDLARRLETEPLARLDFPLFDGQQVHLVDIKHTAKDSTAGVFFAKVEGEAQGGHAILAYAKNALAGSIHLPSKGLYFLVHNAAPQGEAPNQSFLIQLDPTKMPKCGTCDPNNAVHLTPVSAQPKP